MRGLYETDDAKTLNIEEEFTTSTITAIKVKGGKIYTMFENDKNTVEVEEVKHIGENKTLIKTPSNEFERKIKERLQNNLNRFNTRY